MSEKKTMSGWLSSTILSPSSSRDTESMSGENTNAMSEIEKNEVENNVDIWKNWPIAQLGIPLP